MGNILKPDKVITTSNGLKINQKIIPATLLASKNIASYVKKGNPLKPCKLLNNGSGAPKGVTVHNTAAISLTAGAKSMAEQYCRATYNGNMSGVVVHFYVHKSDIWQLLNLNERGWHAADGSTRRLSQRGKGDKIGGNLDTIAIECIDDSKESEETTAKLVAWLCHTYNLSPATDVYQHHYFYAAKNCPVYIIPHWSAFISTIQRHYNALRSGTVEKVSKTYTVQSGDTLWSIAKKQLGSGLKFNQICKLNNITARSTIKAGQVLKMP